MLTDNQWDRINCTRAALQLLSRTRILNTHTQTGQRERERDCGALYNNNNNNNNNKGMKASFDRLISRFVGWLPGRGALKLVSGLHWTLELLWICGSPRFISGLIELMST